MPKADAWVQQIRTALRRGGSSEHAQGVQLEKSVAKFGEREFKQFEGWLDRVSSWADHDALVHYLLVP